MGGRLDALSLRAIRTTAALPCSDARTLSRRLYAYGAVPRGPTFDLDFGPGDDALAVLGLTSGGGVRARLARDYDATTYPGWVGFGRLGQNDSASSAFKLYASPRPEALATAFPILAQVFADLEVRAFKVGRGPAGLLRCDKIVAYFDSREHLRVVAAALARKLAGCPAQGVPFTAALGADGLLSWGIDPPPPAEGPAQSWRSWITGKLADAILAVRRPDLDPAGPVLARMTADGVVDWRPAASRPGP
ncbi:hypothetical protein [Phenylobacterium sp.]|uniref:hypothetical protein n=1 Tax=Phenylobacterium sp. TaxID=1871053 RepID=UPI00286D14AD|nr:hypothetical protein [Phenylobacterium sp.]